MITKNDITFNDDKVTIHKEMQPMAIDAIQGALDKMEKDGTWEAQITLTWAEMQRIRSLVIADEVTHNLAYFNVKTTNERRKAERDKI